MPTSSGRPTLDPTVYTGTTGIALTLLRLGRYQKNDGYTREALRLALLACSTYPQSEQVSFFCGTPGGLAVACVAAHELGDSAVSDRCLADLVAFGPAAERHQEDELLFGRAGYLYAVLWVRARLGTSVSAELSALLDDVLGRVAERTVASGRQLAAAQRHNVGGGGGGGGGDGCCGGGGGGGGGSGGGGVGSGSGTAAPAAAAREA